MFGNKKKTKLVEFLSEINQATQFQHGTDKESCHGYISNFYEKEFLPFKDKNIKLLEIGIYTGDSILLWGKYFNDADIYAIDIDFGKIRALAENVKYILGNGYSEKVFNNLPNFDIIIDDGPHSIDTQLAFIESYLPKLNVGGLMIIEDIHHSEEDVEILFEAILKHGVEYEFIDFKKLSNSKIIKIKK